MPEVFLEVKGLGETLNRQRRLPAIVATEMKAGLLAAANIVADEAKSQIQNSSAVRTSDGRQASAPGRPPVSQTGKLLRSIGAYPAPRKKYLTASVIVRDPGAMALEYGRRGAEPRPFVRPALDKRRFEILSILSAAARRAVEKLRAVK